MRKIILLLIFTINIFFYSCSKDEIVTPDKALLKVKYWSISINDTIPSLRYEYQYDNSKRLERINQYIVKNDEMVFYEIFKYNIDNKLESKYNYIYEGSLHDSTHYSYENGMLILEELHYPTLDYQFSTHYEYDGSKITKVTLYDNHGDVSYVKLLYDNEVCVK
jgi:hypothetical protein